MRGIFYKKKNFFIGIVILFVIGQLIGSFAIRSLFLKSKLNELEPLAKQLAIGYATNQIIYKPEGMIVLIYDIYGNEILFNHDDSQSIHQFDFQQQVKKYLPKIVTAQVVSSIEEISGLPSHSVMIGVPIIDESSIIGGVFVLVPDSTYHSTLMGFTLVFMATLMGGLLLIGAFFQQYFIQIKDLERMRKNYIANISHELKSPIASIRALTETLSDNMITDDEIKQRYYTIIQSESKCLEKLVLDMLELSKIQSGKLDFIRQKTMPEEIFIEVCQKYEALCDDMDITLVVSKEIKSLPPLLTNAERIRQLLTILLDNAVKFVGEDGKIILDAKVCSNEVIVCVQDNGIGIKQEAIDYIFERFYKEDKAHNTKGSGLGLAIAREICYGLQESIRVESELNKGTAFYFTIKTV